MTVSMPENPNEATKTVFYIMNGTANGVQQTHNKQQLLSTHFNILLKTENKEPNTLFEEFTDAMNLYIDEHIDTWGFFGFDRDFFLSAIKL